MSDLAERNGDKPGLWRRIRPWVIGLSIFYTIVGVMWFGGEVLGIGADTPSEAVPMSAAAEAWAWGQCVQWRAAVTQAASGADQETLSSGREQCERQDRPLKSVCQMREAGLFDVDYPTNFRETAGSREALALCDEVDWRKLDR